MKLLRVNEGCGEYRSETGEYLPIDKIAKEDLLRLADWTLSEVVVELDEYDDGVIKNHAHQVIYKSIFVKLRDLRSRREEFKDASARLFLEDYEKYRGAIAE